ncbi:MAG: hypothetical protein PHQ40_09665, partial [Anaerolineaceae bacterium]|nr:hypothetical protein [Anaerolineaceae bacterium]
LENWPVFFARQLVASNCSGGSAFIIIFGFGGYSLSTLLYLQVLASLELSLAYPTGDVYARRFDH